MHEAHSVKRKKHIDLVRSFPRMCSSNFLPLPVFSEVGKLFNIFLIIFYSRYQILMSNILNIIRKIILIYLFYLPSRFQLIFFFIFIDFSILF